MHSHCEQVGLWVGLVVFLLTTVGNCQTHQPELPNIVIVLVDDMGYGDPGCYNSASKISTPNIDALAKSGMKFTDAHAPGPLCHLSRYGLITGKYPFRATPQKWRVEPSIRSGQLTLPCMLKSKGYSTAMVGKWHLGFHQSGYDQPFKGGPVDIGFDSFFGIPASTDIPPYFYIRNDQAVQAPTLQVEERTSPGWTKIQGEFSRAGLTSPNLKLNDVLPRFTTEAISVIDRHRKENSAQPLFLYLAYPAPHTPWLPSAEFVGSSRASMYGDFCQMVDANVGKVLNSLQKNGMNENTMVIFTSDNGPVWYPDDVKRFQHDCSGGLRGMKADGWEGGHRMPFIVRWPAKTQPGSVSNQIICFTDLMATFAELVGYKIKNKTDLDSVSFLGVLLGMITESNPVRDYLVIAAGNGMKTIRKGQWKYLDGPGPGGFSRKHFKVGKNQTGGQLYNLKTDPGEQANLFDKWPDLVSELKLEMDRIVQKNDQTNRE